jgi:integrase
MRGDGRIFKCKGSRFFWMAYCVNGIEVRESTKETEEDKARRVLRRVIAEVLRGEAVPHENKVTLESLCEMLTTDYQTNGRRSLKTLPYSLQHLLDFFGPTAKATTMTTDRIQRYIAARQAEDSSSATINIELALLGRAFTLAVRARRLRSRPYVPKLAADPSRVRQGFFSRQEIESLTQHMPADIADAVEFLFFSTWRVGEMRTLEWRDYDRADGVIRLRPEKSKNKHGRLLPVEGEIARIIERRLEKRRLDCPSIFHQGGMPIGDFRKVWKRACAAIGLAGRIVHDLRRSGVRHLIRAGVPPHTVMAFSGHRTNSMLKRYDIISLDDLRAAAQQGSDYAGQPAQVVPLRRENS